MDLTQFWNQLHVAEHLQRTGESVAHHSIALVLFSVVGYLSGVVAHRRHQAKYGMRVVARMLWFKEGSNVLREQNTRSGDAIFMTGDKEVAAILVKAARKSGHNTFLGKQFWNKEDAARTLRRLCEGIATQFADGALGCALHDKNVTEKDFFVAAFRRRNIISVIVIRKDDLARFKRLGSGNIMGPDTELREATELSSMLESQPEYVTEIPLSR